MGIVSQPMSEEAAETLYEKIFVGLGGGSRPLVEGCDHTLKHAEAWAQENGIELVPFRAWLHDNGGFCDCEVLYNVMPEEEDE
jgi:hypothetical protein